MGFHGKSAGRMLMSSEETGSISCKEPGRTSNWPWQRRWVCAASQNIVNFCVKNGREESSGVQAGAWGGSGYVQGTAGVWTTAFRRALFTGDGGGGA